jgi:gluconolactonase
MLRRNLPGSLLVTLCAFGVLPAAGGCSASGGDEGDDGSTSGRSGSKGGSDGSGGSVLANGGSTPLAGASSNGGAGAGESDGAVGGGGMPAGGGAFEVFSCPPGPFPAPLFGDAVRVERVEGVPPPDAFNQNNQTFGNVEGPVWFDDALYVSEIGPGSNPPPSRVLRITEAGEVTVAIADSGSNGLAISPAGELFGALHKDGSISRLSLTGGASEPVASMFGGARFNSPNDLAIHASGTIFFSDPEWQAPSPAPQGGGNTRLYRVAPGGEPQPIEKLNAPNGVTLSKDQRVLYVAGNQLRKYPVMPDGSVGAGSDFVVGGSGDGMVIDCADNLYVAHNGVSIYSAAGSLIGTISVQGVQQVTNLAFGGSDRKTLYITALGSGSQKGLFKAALDVPGFPY